MQRKFSLMAERHIQNLQKASCCKQAYQSVFVDLCMTELLLNIIKFRLFLLKKNRRMIIMGICKFGLFCEFKVQALF